ncbi:ECF-type riboflavin transporter substrate-binding protein [Streptococcus equinus]|uniref:ECF-type riboflavin transporter substrate-binding protein n=1 Tax=Streptococcus equinus TaxID=1335 RepID=UPI0008878246|nr:ECF-type riboflavin transporter substrate-binding protein [Streptococcus equinus]SDQ30619.1 energy-coupling factor transport system substrate-specific component [Streptococcus equinus]SEN72608.1 energy-coupling factor transport system substrate-specific component [Streptococcus equinus]
MKNNSIKTVVATGIGAALFIIIGTLVNIPTPIPNTNLQLQYAVLALFAVVYGPTVGFFSGFIGHALKDALQYGSPWWTWVLVSGLIGLAIGLVSKKINIEKGQLTGKDYVWFNGAQILANIIGWAVIAPYGDILVYSEPASKVFTQGILSAVINSLTIVIGGSLLLAVYTKTRTQSGSLTKD